jgi:hypothetical protein
MHLPAVHRAFACALCASLLWAASALAQSAPTVDTDSARTASSDVPSTVLRRTPSQASNEAIVLGHEGLKLMEVGQYQRALSLFAQAEQRAHSPVFLIYQARANWWLGRYQAALALYRACSAEVLEEESPALWKETVVEAERESTRLSRQVPVIHLSFSGAWSPPIAITIARPSMNDGKIEVARSELLSAEPRRMELDPGRYFVTVRDGQDHVVERALSLQSGGQAGLHFIFPAPLVREKRRSSVVSPRSGPSALRVGAYAAWSSGGALLVGGAVAGGVAMALAQDVLQACAGDVCPAEEQVRAERAERWGRLAAAGLVSGLVGEVAGTVLWLYDRQEKQWQLTSRGTVLSLEGTF